LIHQALHPHAQHLGLAVDLWTGCGRRAGRRGGQSRGVQLHDPVANGNDLLSLVGEAEKGLADFGELGVGGVDVVELSHAQMLANSRDRAIYPPVTARLAAHQAHGAGVGAPVGATVGASVGVGGAPQGEY